MNLKFNYLLFLFCSISLILISSCEKEEDIQSKLDRLEGKGYFPMHVGNYWKYTDFPKTKIDAVELINSKEYFRFITQNDTAYYRKTPENKILYLTKDNKEILLYDLSANAGQIWTTFNDIHDSSYVKLSLKNDTIEINNYTFVDCYKYSSDDYNQMIIDNESSTWLAPNIGRIQISGGIGIKKLTEVQIDGINIKF